MDLTWDHFDRLVESYAAASSYVSNLQELEVRIAQASAVLLNSRKGIADFTALLSTRAGHSEEVPRKVAWAAQHIFGRRAWCVGQKVVLRRDGGLRALSPLVGQLQLLGHMPTEAQFAAVDQVWQGSGYAAHEKIDALMAGVERSEFRGRAERSEFRGQSSGNANGESPSSLTSDLCSPTSSSDLCSPTSSSDLCPPISPEILLIKGASYSQAKRVSPDLWVNADKQSLFAVDGTRFMTHLNVRREPLAALLLARDILRATFPGMRVRAVFLVINDPDCSWHFQAHDVTVMPWESLKKSRVCLDPYPLAATFRAFQEAFSSDSDTFAGLPTWSGDNFLAASPVDRPTRALMLLDELWHRQLNKPERLITTKGADLAATVQDRFAVAYPADMWRHDLEDCLERGRFVRRASDRDNAFALLPKGVARLILLKQKFNPNTPAAPAMVIHHVARQARLWATAPVG